MAIKNYSELLNYIGLSNWQFISIVVVLLLIWAVLATFWKIGALKKVDVLLGFMPPLKCVYISYLGSYDHFDKIYSQSTQDFDMVFKFSNHFCIFYDDPAHQSKGASSKALIGVVVSQVEQAKINLFLSKFPQYKVCDFPRSKSLRVQYPFIGSLSSIMAIGVVYPALQKKIEDLQLNLKNRQIIQIYHSNQEMSIIIPIENEEAFQKWYQPTAYTTIESEKDK